MPNAAFSFYVFVQLFLVLLFASLAVRLISANLWKRYPVFFWFIALSVLESTWPFLLNTSSDAYEHIWIVTEPVFYIFHVFLVVELYGLVLENHRGLYSLGKWATYLAVVIATGISILSLIPHFNPHTTQQSKLLGYYYALSRGIDFGLSLFLILILFFLSRYPVRLSRNVLVHAAIYTIFFFVSTLGVFMRTFFGIRASQQVSEAMSIANCICLVAWLIFLTPAGERVQAAFPTLSPDRERHVLLQLETLNATLLKAGARH